jgi:hypothetical protein
MAEIVDLSQRRASSREPSSADNAAIAEVKKQRIRDLKTRLDERPRMLKESERATVATNLWRLLEQTEAKGIKKSRVVQSWRDGAATDSTKRLYTYTLPPDLPEDERTQRIGQLTQKVAGYRALAEHAAKLEGRDADIFLEEVFRGTGYESPSNSLPDELNAPWVVYMRDLVQKMCAWVAKRNALKSYFAQIEKERLSIADLGREWADDLVSKGWYRDITKIALNDLIHWDSIGHCIPTVLLTRTQLQSIDAEILVSEKTENGVVPVGEGEGVPAECRIETHLELYLSIAPLGPERSPTGVFELRVKTDICQGSAFENIRLASFEDYFDECYGGKSRPLDDWRLIWCESVDKDDLVKDRYPAWVRALGEQHLNKYIRPPELKVIYHPLVRVSGCRLFREVDLGGVYDFLGSDYVPEDTYPGFECEAWAANLELGEDENPVMSPPETLAHLIEKNLHTTEETRRIDNLLDQNAKFLVASVNSYLEARRANLARLKSQTLGRYEQ